MKANHEIYFELQTLHSDCRILKKSINDDDIQAKLDNMELRLTGLLLDMQERGKCK